MPVAIVIGANPGLEICLALAARSGDREFWQRAAALACDLPVPAALARLPAAIDKAAQEAFDESERRRLAAELAAFLPGFTAAYETRADCYARALARLNDRLTEASQRRDVDLGDLAGLPLSLEPYRRGLRAGAGGMRLAANRLERIDLVPTAYDAGGFWHRRATAGGRHVVLLPCHDATLAREMAGPVPTDPAVVARSPGPAVGDGADEIAHFCTALGDASRRSIAKLLARETLSAAEIGRRLGLSPPAVSHHLNALRKAGLIVETRCGQRRDLALNQAMFDGLGDRLLAHLAGTPVAGTSRRR
jgi:DNA-binding transcriptional ArsR family regulator